MHHRILLISLGLIFFQSGSYCQQATVTMNALERTFMIETAHGRGTTFSIDVDNREYWITAKHMFTGIKKGPAGVFTTKTVQANVLSNIGGGEDGHEQHWKTVEFTTIDPGRDIDILVLAPDHVLLGYPREFNLNSDPAGALFGGDCEFIGFPYGGGWKIKWSATKQWLWLPYIKHCGISGGVRDKDVDIYVLDGINNEGFSGGPVLYGTGPNQKVIAVISGFYQEPLEVMPAPQPGVQTSFVPPAPELPSQQPGQHPKEIVEANSGFIVAFDIQAAIRAIRANPIGPLRPETTPEKKPS